VSETTTPLTVIYRLIFVNIRWSFRFNALWLHSQFLQSRSSLVELAWPILSLTESLKYFISGEIPRVHPILISQLNLISDCSPGQESPAEGLQPDYWLNT
jgi:hypothetical protein